MLEALGPARWSQMAALAVRRSSRLAGSSPLQPLLPVKAQTRIASLPVRSRDDNCEPVAEGKSARVLRKRRTSTRNDSEDPAGGSVKVEEQEETVMAFAPVETATRRSRAPKVFPSRSIEAELWQLGFKYVAGVDEAGRGPLAGPVVAAACLIPANVIIEGVNDSKKLTEKRRDELFLQIISAPGVTYAVHIVDVATIDSINILQATMQAMTGCVEKLKSGENGVPVPDYVLVDGTRLPDGWSTETAKPVVRGDAESFVIAAASILAKVTRDRLMLTYDKMWPVYGFKENKGYGTAAHIAAMRKHGPCDIHRRSFAPLRTELL